MQAREFALRLANIGAIFKGLVEYMEEFGRRTSTVIYQPEAQVGQDVSITLACGGRRVRVTYRQEGQDSGAPEVEIALVLGVQDHPAIAWWTRFDGHTYHIIELGCSDPVVTAVCEQLDGMTPIGRLIALLADTDKHKNTPVA